jgi:predicted NUDIX family NTP pyrophosphohydrolase
MTDRPPRPRVSAGILLFRRGTDGVEVLLGHPGGPYFDKRHDGVWSIPKGEADDGEELWVVAKREFGEETGHVIGSSARTIALGSVTQRGGKVVHAWAVEGDMDPSQAWSNTFEMEWPPHSGIVISVPELDRVAWFAPEAARIAINPAQVALVDLLVIEVARLASLEAQEQAAREAAGEARGDGEEREQGGWHD